MDSLTQASLGAAIGYATMGHKTGPKAAVLGAVIATIPDLDVVVLPLYDDLERISVHRGFSHSILFSILGALIIALILHKMRWIKGISIRYLFCASWLLLFTHILLDAFTSYGTQLFLPFSDYRVSFDSITIVDPIYTIPLLIGLLVSLYKSYQGINLGYANLLGIGVSSLYLLFTLGHKHYVESRVKEQLLDQSISYHELRTIPVSAANLNWYGVAMSSDSLYLGKYKTFDQKPIRFDAFAINDHLLARLDKTLVDRLRWFSQNMYTVAEHNGVIRMYNLQCDMQGVRHFGDYQAPTAFYFQIQSDTDSTYKLSTGMHPKEYVKTK